jgi:hypothetical protein
MTISANTNLRLITVPIWGDGQLTIPCPEWCAADHTGPEHAVDISHAGVETRLEVRDSRGKVMPLLTAYLSHYPHGRTANKPYVAFGADEEAFHEFELGEFDELLVALKERLAGLEELRAELAAATGGWQQ